MLSAGTRVARECRTCFGEGRELIHAPGVVRVPLPGVLQGLLDLRLLPAAMRLTLNTLHISPTLWKYDARVWLESIRTSHLPSILLPESGRERDAYGCCLG